MNNLAEPIKKTHSRESYEKWDRTATDMQKFSPNKGKKQRALSVMNKRGKTFNPKYSKHKFVKSASLA